MNNLKTGDMAGNVMEVSDKEVKQSLAKMNTLVKRYNLDKVLEEIPPENILFQNYVFKNLDAEDLFNRQYLEDVFFKIVDYSASWKPELIFNDSEIVINYPNYSIKISKTNLKENIEINNVVFDLNQNWKAQYEKDLATIRSILYAFSLQGFDLNYVKDSLKIWKHKDFLKDLLKQEESKKTKLLENKKKLDETLNTDKKSEVKLVKDVFSFYLANNFQLLSSMSKQWNMLLEADFKTKEWQIFHQVVNQQYNHQLLQVVSYIEKTTDMLEIMEFATNYKELLEKINISLKNNSIVIIEKTPSKFEKLWKKAKNKILFFKK